MNLLVKSGPRDLNRQNEPKIRWKSQQTSQYLLIVYLWSLHLVYSLKFWLSFTFVTITELITVPFGETNHTSCALYFFYSTS